MLRPTTDNALPALPMRSKRIATQNFSHILASNRGEYLVMKRMGLATGMLSPSTSAKKTYNEMFNGDPAHMQALRELFLVDDLVGACKQHRCRLAARA